MIKSDYICTVPFSYTEVHSDEQQFLCCSAWLPVNVYESENIKGNFLSDKSNEIRESIIDGSYKYCDEKACPHLASLLSGKQLDKKFRSKKLYGIPKPKMREINFDFDRSCNLQCPSCRVEIINYLGVDRKRVDDTIRQIENEYSKDLQYLYITATGDPFYSKSFRQFLINLEPKKYPVLRNIHLHTNAILWTENMWKKMKGAQQFIRTVEVSIDAATKETYSKVRKGGDFDILKSNLEFITNIDSITKFIFSFVVQKDNFREMKQFVNFIESFDGLKGKKYQTYFYDLQHWGTWTDEEYIENKVSREDSPFYEEFKLELNSINNINSVGHNLHQHITPVKNKLL